MTDKQVPTFCNDEKLQKLNDFVANIDCLEPLNAWINEINIFNILRLEKMEIRHSNFLAWLLDPTGTHGLDDRFLKNILIRAVNNSNIQVMKGVSPINIDLMDLTDVSIDRELKIANKRQIDVLVVSPKNNLVFLIENKIDSKEGNNQLVDYRDYVLGAYGNTYKYVLVYLTPNGDEPSDVNYWRSLDYGIVLEELNKLYTIYKDNIPAKAQIFIEDYINIIRRLTMTDKELNELVTKIYINHKEALDLIFANKPNRQSAISQVVKEYIATNKSKFADVKFGDCVDNYWRFVPNEIYNVFKYKCKEVRAGMNCMIQFEIAIETEPKEKDKIFPLISRVFVGPAAEESDALALRNKVIQAAITEEWRNSKPQSDNLITIKNDTLISRNDLEKLADDIISGSDGAKKIVMNAVENYMLNTVPKITKVILEAVQPSQNSNNTNTQAE